MTEWLAHSARRGRPTQTYLEHIGNVTRGCLLRARRMLRYYRPDDGRLLSRRKLLTIAGDSSSYHDFGKLDDGFQETLNNNRRSDRHVRHEDAGAVLLAEHGAMEAAGLVSAHHRGLVRYSFEEDRKALTLAPSRRLALEPFRIDDPATRRATDTRLEEYAHRHERLFGLKRTASDSGLSECSGFTRRLLLSCLVDADHSDTARHYGNEPRARLREPHWGERLAALDRYVSELHEKSPAERGPAAQLGQKIRDELYSACRDADVVHPLRSCDAVVGSGKTTAVMAHLLRVAEARGLRHIFVVLPYTNIIKQSVDTYRKALCLPGENPNEIVAEHHHQVEFKDLDLRHLTTLWKAPIIVTTAVQFFETLGSNHPARLRKLHELPGSAVFLDEAHAAMPTELWPLCWQWIREWTEFWGGHLVLASGSLPEFWKIEDFRCLAEGRDCSEVSMIPAPDVRPLSEHLRDKSKSAEHERIHFHSFQKPLSETELIERIEESRGPRLVIVNTVQSAAVLAKKMHDRGKQRILHLSTALAPIHRGIIVDRVKQLLQFATDWTLVATSLVEAGLDFSFATGFRQRSSTASLIQTGGRVNRGADSATDCEVWDFDFADTKTFPNNPALRNAQQALARLFEAGSISADKPLDLQRICVDAMKMEFKSKQQNSALDRVRLEMQMDYPQVAEVCRLIDSNTRLVLIDRSLLAPIKAGRKLPGNQLIQRSVQMYPHKIADFGLEPVIHGSDELFVLPDGWSYDPDCFGYMAGWLTQQDANIAGGYFV